MFSCFQEDDPRRDWLRGFVLVALIFLAYQSIWNAGFVWNDPQYLAESVPLRSWHGLWQIWFQPGATEQYYPLTETVFFMEYRLWGLAPGGYHLDSPFTPLSERSAPLAPAALVGRAWCLARGCFLCPASDPG